MEQRVGDGVMVCTLTNSLASTNHLTVHAGYVRHRDDLLRSGVRMHELKPSEGDVGPFGFLVGGSRAGIHTKAVVFDRERVFVGTFNLDPRSAELNTEIGVLVDSPALAGEVADFILEGMHPELSWQVQLRKVPLPVMGSGLRWATVESSGPRVVRREPDTGPLTRLLLRLTSWLPIQSQL
jgi:putative cardiolipin synthase